LQEELFSGNLVGGLSGEMK